MTQALEDAFSRLRELPDDAQDRIVRVLRIRIDEEWAKVRAAHQPDHSDGPKAVIVVD